MIPNTSHHQPENEDQLCEPELLGALSLTDTPTTTSTEVLAAHTDSSTGKIGDQSLLQESAHHPTNESLESSPSFHTASTSADFKDPSKQSGGEHERTGQNTPDPNTSGTPIVQAQIRVDEAISSQRFGHHRGTKGSRWDFGGADVAEPGDFAFGGHSYAGNEL
jgi:hypothetical protein